MDDRVAIMEEPAAQTPEDAVGMYGFFGATGTRTSLMHSAEKSSKGGLKRCSKQQPQQSPNQEISISTNARSHHACLGKQINTYLHEILKLKREWPSTDDSGLRQCIDECPYNCR